MMTADEGLAELASVTHAKKSLITSSPVSVSRTWAIGTAEGAEGWEENNNIDEGSSPLFDILSWYEKVDSGSEPFLPLTPSPFERGAIGGPSVNDTLMIKGLIHPLAYVHFLDLSYFSLS